MFVVDKETNRITKIHPKSFSELGVMERYHLQEWIENNPKALGEELLYIQKEFDGFGETRERLDLLAIDKQGNLVIIENKIDDSGRDVTWQVLKYASYCSSLTNQHIKDIYQSYLNRNDVIEDSEQNIAEFLDKEDLVDTQLNQTQRIILVAREFRREVTSTVLWLLNNYKMNIQCFKATPYEFEGRIFLNIEKIIPVKEIEDYTIRMAEKSQEEQTTQQELKDRQKLRIAFWKEFLNRFNAKSTLFSNISPSKESWISSSVGLSGVGLNFVVTRNSTRTELYISRESAEENKFIFDKLHSQKIEIEKQTGPLQWDRLDGKKACRIKDELSNVSLYEREDWNNMMNFLMESMLKMELAFKKPVRQIRSLLKDMATES